MSSIQIQSGKQAALVFTHTAEQDEQTHFVEENASTIVGRDQSCGIVLDDQMVSGRHCMFRVAEGKLFVSDWHSEHGTLVNGQAISQETELGNGDQVTIGNFSVSWSVAGGATSCENAERNDDESEPSASEFNSTEPSREVASVLDSVNRLSNAADVSTPLNSYETDSSSNSRIRELERENEELRSEMETLLSTEFHQDPQSSAQPMGLDQQEVQLLRDEVAQLQSELAERDQQLSEFLDAEYAGDESPSENVSTSETEQLVQRLEQLLDELQSSDRRVASMEELLRAADDAQQAEIEERQQIEVWLSEIEQRVGQREQEWKSQNEQLTQRVDELTEERSRIQSQWSAALKSSGNQAAKQAEQELVELRSRNETLESSLHSTRNELQSVRTRLDAFESEQEEGESSLELRQRLKQQELEMVQERAALSRQKAELARMRDEMEQVASSSTKDVKSSDLRLKALRDHLREIHDEEKEEKQAQGGGLASRLSRLWNRLDSR